MNQRISGPDLHRLGDLLTWLGRKFKDESDVDTVDSLENMPDVIESLRETLVSVINYHNEFVDSGLHQIPPYLPGDSKDQIRMLIKHRGDLYSALVKATTRQEEARLLQLPVSQMTGLELQNLILYSTKRAEKNRS